MILSVVVVYPHDQAVFGELRLTVAAGGHERILTVQHVDSRGEIKIQSTDLLHLYCFCTILKSNC